MGTATCTSKASFLEVRDQRMDLRQKKKIFDIVKANGVMTLREIQKAFHVEHNVYLDVGTISGRVNALIYEHEVLLRSKNTSKCPISGRTVHPVFVASN